jgi:hypothetical protein
MVTEPSVFDKPTVVARYDAATVPVPVYIPSAARRAAPSAARRAAPPPPRGRRPALALVVLLFVTLVVASSLAGYAAWAAG